MNETNAAETRPDHWVLVRDKFPDEARRAGIEGTFRIAEPHERLPLLREKLMQTSEEFLRSEMIDDLVEVAEVVYALAEEIGLTTEELEEIRVAKAEERGGFSQRIVWYGNKPEISDDDDAASTPAEAGPSAP